MPYIRALLWVHTRKMKNPLCMCVCCCWLFAGIVVEASLVGSGNYFLSKIWDPCNCPLPPSGFNSPKVWDCSAVIARAPLLVTSKIQGVRAMSASNDYCAYCNTK